MKKKIQTNFGDFLRSIRNFVNPPKLVFLIGVCGSGKSSWIKENKKHWKKTVVVEPDQIRREIFGDVSDQSEPNRIWYLVRKQIISKIKSNKNVILDGTNVYASSRKQLIEKLREEIDFELEAKIFHVEPDIARDRIKKDLENNVDRAKIPDNIIDQMYDAFRHTLTVLESEGFKIIDKYEE